MSVESVVAKLRESCAILPAESFAFAVDRGVQTRPAAVLVPIIDYGDSATILLTKRTSHLTAHAGQICFPGGMWEEADESLLATALRECEEELAIAADSVHIIGQGRGRITGTGFEITPFIGYLQAPVAWKPDPFEVELAFELPLDMAIRRSAYALLHTEHDGVKRAHDVLHYEGHCIWGATAGILRDMCRMVNDEGWEDPAC